MDWPQHQQQQQRTGGGGEGNGGASAMDEGQPAPHPVAAAGNGGQQQFISPAMLLAASDRRPQQQQPGRSGLTAAMMMPPTLIGQGGGGVVISGGGSGGVGAGTGKFHWPFGVEGGQQRGPVAGEQQQQPQPMEGDNMDKGNGAPAGAVTAQAMLLGARVVATSGSGGGGFQGQQSMTAQFMTAQLMAVQQQKQQQQPPPLQTGAGRAGGTHHQHHHPQPILPRHDVAILPKPTPAPVGSQQQAQQARVFQGTQQAQQPQLQPRPVVKTEVGDGAAGGCGPMSLTAASMMLGVGGGGAKRGAQSESTWTTADEEGMSEERKKRLRNEREQRRAHLITDQIESLKQVLEDGNYPLRSSSKYDILAGCDEYIQHLRQRKSCLDMELKLGAAAAASQGGGSVGGVSSIGGGGGSGTSGGNGGEESSSLSSEDGEQREMVLDFSEIFRSSHVPMAVVSIDGRILQCNDEFSRATDISNDKLSGVTLFSLAAPEALEELFKSIARLLSTAALDERNPAYFATAAAKAAPFAHPGYEGASILMSLVRDDERRARAFHCCIVPPSPGPRSSNGGLGRSSSASSVSSGGGQGDAIADDGSIMS